MAILGKAKTGTAQAKAPSLKGSGRSTVGSTPFSTRNSFRLKPRAATSGPMNAAFQMANANFPYPGYSSIQGFGQFGQYGQ